MHPTQSTRKLPVTKPPAEQTTRVIRKARGGPKEDTDEDLEDLCAANLRPLSTLEGSAP